MKWFFLFSFQFHILTHLEASNVRSYPQLFEKIQILYAYVYCVQIDPFKKRHSAYKIRQLTTRLHKTRRHTYAMMGGRYENLSPPNLIFPRGHRALWSFLQMGLIKYK